MFSLVIRNINYFNSKKICITILSLYITKYIEIYVYAGLFIKRNNIFMLHFTCVHVCNVQHQCAILMPSRYFSIFDCVARTICSFHLGTFVIASRSSFRSYFDDASSRNVISLDLWKRLQAISENLKFWPEFGVERRTCSVERSRRRDCERGQ